MKKHPRPSFLRVVQPDETPEQTQRLAEIERILAKILDEATDPTRPVEVNRAYADILKALKQVWEAQEGLTGATKRYNRLKTMYGIIDEEDRPRRAVPIEAPSEAPAPATAQNDPPPCPSWCEYPHGGDEDRWLYRDRLHERNVGTVHAVSNEHADVTYKIDVYIEQLDCTDEPDNSIPAAVNLWTSRDPRPEHLALDDVADVKPVECMLLAAEYISGHADNIDCRMPPAEACKLAELIHTADHMINNG